MSCSIRYGADIGFAVAGASGLGQIDAAKETNHYAIGVDSDQAMLFKDSDPQNRSRPNVYAETDR